MVRSMDWNLVYCMNIDGVSMQTFKQRARNHSYTALIIKDDQSFIFGAFSSEAWKLSKGFFGNGENFVFTFRD